MKKEHAIVLIFFAFLIIGCNNSKVNKEDTKVVVLDESKKEVEVDTSLVKIADLPFHIDSTKYLIYPIGFINENRFDKGYLYKSKRSDADVFYLTNSYNGDQISGSMNNLMFQSLDSDNLKQLTKKNIKINSVKFLRDVFNKSKRQLLLYEVVDTDTNEDKELNMRDFKSLYLSEIDGSNFTRISIKNDRILQTKIISVNDRLYFKTIERSESKEEKIKPHYYYVNLLEKKFETIEYFPFKNQK